MRRKSIGKTVSLTPRDIELLKLLDRYRYLRSSFLHAFLGGASATRFKERLGHLYHEGRYINRPAQQWQFANCRYMPAIYELDDAGEQVLRDYGLREEGPLLRKGCMGAHRQFAHALMISDILASIELGVRDNPRLRFISWREILARAPEKTRHLGNPFAIPVSITHTFASTRTTLRADTKIVPDGLFGLEYAGSEKSYRFFALEADRNKMPIARSNLNQTSYLKKILCYREVAAKKLHQSHFGLPNLLVLNVTPNAKHMDNILDLVRQLTGGSKLFLFKTMSTLGDFEKAPPPSPHILTEPWKRAGHDDFNIGEV
jgi:hypothetical protein